jgi:hypothetical protein
MFKTIQLTGIKFLIITTSSYASKIGDLNNVLETCRMGTPLCGCKALSICANVCKGARIITVIPSTHLERVLHTVVRGARLVFQEACIAQLDVRPRLLHEVPLPVLDIVPAVRAAVVQVRNYEVLLHQPAQHLESHHHQESM